MSLSRLLVTILNRLQPSAETVMLVSAIAVGVISGIGVTLFRKLILIAQEIYWHEIAVALSNQWHWAIIFIPMLGALVVSLVRLRLDQVEAKTLSKGQIVSDVGQSYSQVPLKTLAAALSLGSGASLGPEGPSVELGSNIGSILGQMLQFSSERIRLLIGAGGAAGLAAGFNAPIAGVFFALEVLLRDSYRTNKSSPNSDVSVVVIASVISALVSQISLGERPAFSLPVYEVRSYWELPIYLGLGVLASVVALMFASAVKQAKKFFAGEWAIATFMQKLSLPVKLLIGGLCVGIIALTFPEAIGIGYETVESILQDTPFTIPLLGILLVIKLLLTAISSASGFVGGLFAPSIFLGAVLGSLYGQAIASLLPASIPIAASPAYALVGMAAVLAGTVRAPLTSVLLLFEMTRDYRIVLPLMAAVGLCAWILDQLDTSKTDRMIMQWSNLPADIEVLEKIKIAEVMTLNPASVKYSMPVLQAAQFITSGYHHSALVFDDVNHLQGILTTQDLKRILSAPTSEPAFEEMTVQNICTREVLCTFADESLAEALKRMATRDLRQMPVVDRNQPKRVIGMVDRLAITTAYNTALTKRAIAARITPTKPNTSTSNTNNAAVLTNTLNAANTGANTNVSNGGSRHNVDHRYDDGNTGSNGSSNNDNDNPLNAPLNNKKRELDIHSSEIIPS
ncbi:MAG: chloride channel protein [Pseudanabaena sp.]|jgi:H+/Cl- antiporter ClcA|uniref:chloride channel protein n=1 Tax=Pseudanabaena mucicola TaxID=71190 RepID=UPI002575568E|nr:chloride channel protein [Pseudanabaena mucicola]MCA6572500.1 chloride channel protein [Pseudanabaena sp. M53BS1SP1A06MG]MCA6580760.1 chloride channel protein [Pseudanabaena sp. M34BS1SP1A06MG]MCA6586358.1 chloride channel protein [Pseudanabaena sp. M051S1SP1A06QC]MCA6587781.1 chloride channel protein [Pseudanabaena sp. M109S1SP1A06QC]MCA6591605.1 chloride channel protein [Pseudanabaena sp. M38BS1SP1A06MG]MCA6595761.1 chloride channel protein [Pseudanabaena sp. M046S1SP1A06QC]MCA6599864.1